MPKKPRQIFSVRAGQGRYTISVPKDVGRLLSASGDRFRFELTEDGFRYHLCAPEETPEWLRARQSDRTEIKNSAPPD